MDIYIYIYIYIYIHIYNIYIYIYIYLKHEFDKGMRKLIKYKKKGKLLRKHNRERLHCCYGNVSTLNTKMVTF